MLHAKFPKHESQVRPRCRCLYQRRSFTCLASLICARALLLLLELFRPLSSLGFSYSQLVGAVTDCADLVALLGTQPSVADAPGAPDLVIPGTGAVEVVFDDVSFRGAGGGGAGRGVPRGGGSYILSVFAAVKYVCGRVWVSPRPVC